MASKQSTFAHQHDREMAPRSSPKELAAEIERSVQQDIAKLLAMCRERGIDPDDPCLTGAERAVDSPFFWLASDLARELYPEPKKRGARSKWSGFQMGALVVDMERLIDRDLPDRGINWAAKQLANREPWKSFIGRKKRGETSHDPAEVLRRKYFDFRNDPWAAEMRLRFTLTRTRAPRTSGISGFTSSYKTAFGLAVIKLRHVFLTRTTA